MITFYLKNVIEERLSFAIATALRVPRDHVGKFMDSDAQIGFQITHLSDSHDFNLEVTIFNKSNPYPVDFFFRISEAIGEEILYGDSSLDPYTWYLISGGKRVVVEERNVGSENNGIDIVR